MNRFPPVDQARLRTALVIFFLVVVPIFSHAQGETGRIQISIIDAVDRRPIANVHVTLNPREGEAIREHSNNRGKFDGASLPVGLYDIFVIHPGYRSAQLSSVRIINNKLTPLAIELVPARTPLEETLVIGDAKGLSEPSSVGTSFLSREELRSAAGSGGDALRALDGLPGLFSSGEFASFTVRGSGPRDNLILVDNIPFASIVHFDNSFGSLDDVDGGGRYSVFAPDLIDGVEFQPGGWNSAYGGRAGSLLKVNVAEGNPETPSLSLRLDIAGPEIIYDGPSFLHKSTSILFSSRQLDFGRVFETVGIDDIGSPKLTDIVFKSTTQINDGNKLNVLFVYAPEEFTRDIENVLASDEDNSGNFENVGLTQSERDNTLLALSWETLFADSAQLTNRVYFRQLDQLNSSGKSFPDLAAPNTASSDILLREDIVLSRQNETEIGLRSDFSISNSLGRFSTGFRFSETDLDFSIRLDENLILYEYEQNDFRPNPEQKFIVLTPDMFDSSFSQTSQSYAVYLDQTLDISTWELRLGVRYEGDNLSDENVVSPRLGARWQATSRIELSATAGIYYQSPRFEDRARDISNTRLSNEKIAQASIGLRYYFDSGVEVLVEPYFQDLDNLIVQQDNVNQTIDNTGKGRAYGVDTGLTRRFSRGWSANVNYSFNHSHSRDAPGLGRYDSDFNRPHTFNIGGVWEIDNHWKLSARWKWASGLPRDEFIVNNNVLGDTQPLRFSKEIIGNNTERFQSFHSLNFRADYQRTYAATTIIAFIDIINVYGADNPGSSDFNERTGMDNIEDGQSFPLLGIRLKW